MTARLLEQLNIVSAIVPVDLQTADNEGDWVNLRHYGRLLVVLFKGAGTAGDDPIFKLQQATDNGGSGVADLLFTEIYKKVGAQTGIHGWTKVTQSAATSYVDATSAEAQSIIAVEVRAEMLTPGFSHVRLHVADVGSNAQLGCGFYVMADPRFASAPENMPSAIA